MNRVCHGTDVYMRCGTWFHVALGIDAFERWWTRCRRRNELMEFQPRRLYVNPQQIVLAEGRR